MIVSATRDRANFHNASEEPRLPHGALAIEDDVFTFLAGPMGNSNPPVPHLLEKIC